MPSILPARNWWTCVPVVAGPRVWQSLGSSASVAPPHLLLSQHGSTAACPLKYRVLSPRLQIGSFLPAPPGDLCLQIAGTHVIASPSRDSVALFPLLAPWPLFTKSTLLLAACCGRHMGHSVISRPLLSEVSGSWGVGSSGGPLTPNEEGALEPAQQPLLSHFFTPCVTRSSSSPVLTSSGPSPS